MDQDSEFDDNYKGDRDEDEVKLEKRLLTAFISKKVPPIPSDEERKPYPFHRVNFLSRLFFWWVLPVLRVGYKRTLKPRDLWYLDEKLQVKNYHAIFQAHLSRIVEKAKITWDQEHPGEGEDSFKYPKHAVIRAIFKTFQFDLIFSILLMLLASVALSLNPLLVRELINFVQLRSLGADIPIGKGVGYAIGIALIIWVGSVIEQHAIHLSMIAGAKTKSILTEALLQKSFKLDAKSSHKFPPAKVTSIMSTDVSRIDYSFSMVLFAVMFPPAVVISVVMLIVNLGVSALVGLGFYMVSMLLLGALSKPLFSERKAATLFTDARVNLMKEMLSNMKIIKFYSWELSYSKTISKVRTQEMSFIFTLQILRSIIFGIAVYLPQIASMVTFLVLFKISNGRSIGDIFSSLTYFNILGSQMFVIPLSLGATTDALLGLGRVKEVLEASELEETEKVDYSVELGKLAIKVEHADFQWTVFDQEDDTDSGNDKNVADLKLNKETADADKVSETIVEIQTCSTSNEEKLVKFAGLKDVNLEIEKGEFIIITGVIGSGKSSLLSAISGVMPKTSGEVKLNGSFLFSGQPWIQNTTVKENILFGNEYNALVYDAVVDACALTADLDILPAGDETEIGERGITLSGGQKLRISLARAVYADRDIILLDDVLSAVDSKVGAHIMDKCLMGLLANKTRILATHQLSLIKSAKKIIFLNGDGTMDIGSVEELMAQNSDFASLMSYNSEIKDKELDEDEDSEIEEEEKLELIKSVVSRKDGKLITEEERAVNGMSWVIYKRYIREGSGPLKWAFLPILLTAIVLTTFSQLFTNTWLSFWTEDRFLRSEGFYMGLYVMFAFVAVILGIAQFILLVYLCTTAAKNFNIKAVERVLKLPMSYMDTTPIGRILNRFTKDTDSLDNEIISQVMGVALTLANIIGVLILCIVYLPWFAIAVPFTVFIFISVAGFYQASAREVKRLELIQRSHVYNNFNEVLSGMSVIQAYNQDLRFMKKNRVLLDQMNEAYFFSIANRRWLAIILLVIGCCIFILISMLSVTRQFNISAASVGLLLSYLIDIVGQLSFAVQSYTQLENEMNSAERVSHYAFELEQELAFEISETKPEPLWPEHGLIEFENVSMRYRPGLPLVLKNLTLSVKAGEKIGICGRTGAGKSTIMSTLFRISELAEGKITIDGVDISKIGLHDLRSKLSIIPQESILLRGTIRSNLDPFGDSNDDHLWAALHKSGLVKDVLEAKAEAGDLQKFHLDQTVEDDGANFSLGERQLIALARAVVRDSKILILDEATSSVDYETDAKIQNTVKEEFKHCTILCIAHRLKTIVDYDKILVLDKGELEQFGTPWELFTANGTFKAMCQKSGVVAEDFKRKLI